MTYRVHCGTGALLGVLTRCPRSQVVELGWWGNDTYSCREYFGFDHDVETGFGMAKAGTASVVLFELEADCVLCMPQGEDENEQGCPGTAMHAVHAIAPVCAATPGIHTFLDLPMLTGRHVLG
jgi:hypothetical protein